MTSTINPVAHTSSPDDAIVWPCGSWCFRDELSEYRHKSDDYEVLKEGTQQHASFLLAEGAMEPEEFREFIKIP